MKLPALRTENSAKKSDPAFLISWKEIAVYMRCGVRTVQRYEREAGLPVRRPTGQSRGSVMATRAEIDAWVAAGPIRETFQLSRVDRDARNRREANEMESKIAAMRKLGDQMLALRIETRAAVKLLIDKVSAVRSHMPPARPDGYEPLVNMDMDMNMDSDTDLDRKRRARLDRRAAGSTKLDLSAPLGRTHSRRQGSKTSISVASKPN